MAEAKTKYCEHCGKRIDARAEICPKCGVRIKEPPKQVHHTEKKNEGIAAVLSFLFVGLGQIYNGQIGKGIIFIVIGLFLVASMMLFIGFILYPVFWLYNIYDAHNTAKRINAGEIKV